MSDSQALQVALRDVRLRQELVEYSIDGSPPDWAEGHKFDEGNGGMLLRPFDDGIVVSIGASMQARDVYVSVIVDGFYLVNPESPGLSKDASQNFVDRTPPRLRNGLVQRAATDLFPYIREAIHSATAKVAPENEGIMLHPNGLRFTGRTSEGSIRHYE